MVKTPEKLGSRVPLASRISNLPTYVFVELDGYKEATRARGLDILDLSIGSPNNPPPQPIIDAARKALLDPSNHGYPPFKGKDRFKEAVSYWMKDRYNVDVNPENEVLALIGAKEGIAHLSLAFTNPGDINIAPDPYYPVHSRGTWVADGDVYHVPLKEEQGFLLDTSIIPGDIIERAKILVVNYPNNPTAACAELAYYEHLVDFCRKNNIILVSDLAYGEITFDGYRPPSIFNVSGAKDVAIEFHSCSKSFNMAGWRSGFAVGNEDLINGLYKMKTNCDYGLSTFIQDATVAALTMDKGYLEEIRDEYQERRDLLCKGFQSLGWAVTPPKATMYLWLKVPNGYTSRAFVKEVVEKTGVCFTPGIAFGDYSDQYFRVSLVQDKEKLSEAIERLEKAGYRFQ